MSAGDGRKERDEGRGLRARVMERASENAGRFDIEPEVIRNGLRLLIELNKDEQRERR